MQKQDIYTYVTLIKAASSQTALFLFPKKKPFLSKHLWEHTTYLK